MLPHHSFQVRKSRRNHNLRSRMTSHIAAFRLFSFEFDTKCEHHLFAGGAFVSTTHTTAAIEGDESRADRLTQQTILLIGHVTPAERGHVTCHGGMCRVAVLPHWPRRQQPLDAGATHERDTGTVSGHSRRPLPTEASPADAVRPLVVLLSGQMTLFCTRR